ncbi:MAG: WG repeat-containing protein, partial [Bacteroidales bacterium]|nr:WG repeat-containing protein [Bacteroidales bacterium]
SQLEYQKYTYYDADLGNNSKFGYINTTGNFEIEPIFYKASDFSQGRAFVNIRAENIITETGFSLSMDGFIINKNGVTMSPNIMNTQAWEYSPDGYLPAYNFVISMLFGAGSYFIDTSYNHFPKYNGEELYFNDITIFRDGIAGVRIGDFWRVIDTKSNILIDEKFSDVKTCSEGLMPVKNINKWKYLDLNGTYAFNLEFDSCSRFYDGLAYVEKYERNTTIKGYINKKGDYIWQKIIINNKVKE